MGKEDVYGITNALDVNKWVANDGGTTLRRLSALLCKYELADIVAGYIKTTAPKKGGMAKIIRHVAHKTYDFAKPYECIRYISISWKENAVWG